ncbi:ComEA family DNA-binding protein [Streptomyces sp. 1-11]|uniref:ComEA family DNA-binding protein n=1 Tax=Streptomyces sp. 1-11 TaxID=2590549 RepID=UPI00117FFEDF|nr:ComEA family DNA-binding protein [Streptomyces sp. 1-11]
MALRSRSRTATPTSGPGRGPASDGRVHRRPADRPRARHRTPAPAEELRRRAELLFGERAVHWTESGNAPPDGRRQADMATTADLATTAETVVAAERVVAAETASVTGTAPGLSFPSAAPPAPGGSRETTGETGPASRALGADPAGARETQQGDFTGRLASAGRSGPTLRERTGLAVRERLPVWLQTRCGVERRGVVALAVVLVAAAVFAVQHFWTGRTQTVSAPQVVHAEAPFTGKGERAKAGRSGEASAVGAPSPDTPATSAAQIVVDVGGKVRRPGVQRLPAGARVADALRAAGGVRPGANTEGLNRARFLVDGEQVLVGVPGGAAPAPPGPGGGAGVTAAGGGPAAPVSLSTATVDQLDTLPGVGPVLAQHIIDYRTRHGGFRSVDELRQVNGIGDRRFADLREMVRP